ncbi:MAG: NAD(P)H-dependent oxidoreductase subunit E [bacterium]
MTSEFQTKAEEILLRYPVKRSALMPLLHLWQETHGHVSGEGIKQIAALVGVEPIRVLELATFYPMFRQEPTGKIHIKVCRTLSCFLAGSHRTYEILKKLTKKNSRYTLEFVECLAACHAAPAVIVNDDLHESVDKKKAEEIVRQCA